MNKLGSTTMITEEEGKVIAEELFKLPEKGRLLELGTGFGHSSVFFSSIKPRWSIYTVDGYGLYGEGRNLFNTNGNYLDLVGLAKTQNYINDAKNIISIIGDTNSLFWELELNVLFVDADHTYTNVKKDTERYRKFIIPGGLIIYHDYNDNWGVKPYFDDEMANRKGWKTWIVGCLAFAKKI